MKNTRELINLLVKKVSKYSFELPDHHEYLNIEAALQIIIPDQHLKLSSGDDLITNILTLNTKSTYLIKLVKNGSVGQFILLDHKNERWMGSNRMNQFDIFSDQGLTTEAGRHLQLNDYSKYQLQVIEITPKVLLRTSLFLLDNLKPDMTYIKAQMRHIERMNLSEEELFTRLNHVLNPTSASAARHPSYQSGESKDPDVSELSTLDVISQLDNSCPEMITINAAKALGLRHEKLFQYSESLKAKILSKEKQACGQIDISPVISIKSPACHQLFCGNNSEDFSKHFLTKLEQGKVYILRTGYNNGAGHYQRIHFDKSSQCWKCYSSDQNNFNITLPTPRRSGGLFNRQAYQLTQDASDNLLSPGGSWGQEDGKLSYLLTEVNDEMIMASVAFITTARDRGEDRAIEQLFLTHGPSP